MDILIQCFYTTFTMVHQYKPMPGYLWLAKSVYKCYSCSLGWCYKHISDLFLTSYYAFALENNKL